MYSCGRGQRASSPRSQAVAVNLELWQPAKAWDLRSAKPTLPHCQLQPGQEVLSTCKALEAGQQPATQCTPGQQHCITRSQAPCLRASLVP